MSNQATPPMDESEAVDANIPGRDPSERKTSEHVANTGRKRGKLPNLLRSIASPSHPQKLAMIFKSEPDSRAAQHRPLPFTRMNSNETGTENGRYPLPGFSLVPASKATQAEDDSLMEWHPAEEPLLQSRSPTPANYNDDSEFDKFMADMRNEASIKYPVLPSTLSDDGERSNLRTPSGLHPDGDPELEQYHMENIHSWLDEIENEDMMISPSAEESFAESTPRAPGRKSSEPSSPTASTNNKENVPPLEPPFPIKPPIKYNVEQPPSRVKRVVKRGSPTRQKARMPCTPARKPSLNASKTWTYLSVPPKRRRTKGLEVSPSGSELAMSKPQQPSSPSPSPGSVQESLCVPWSVEHTSPKTDPILHRYGLISALTQANPSVTVERKGRRKRDTNVAENLQTTPSKHDDKMELDPSPMKSRSRAGTPDAKMPLGESDRSEEYTTPPPFRPSAQHAQFNFTM